MAQVHSGIYTSGAVETVGDVVYIHVTHPAYGAYSHLIIIVPPAAKPAAIGTEIRNQWPKGVKITYDFDALKNEPTPHAVGIYKSHTLFS